MLIRSAKSVVVSSTLPSMPSIRVLMLALLAALLVLSGCANTLETSSAQACFNANNRNFSEVLGCYKKAQQSQPLHYTFKEKQPLSGIEKRRFDLTSQHWAPLGLVTPSQWKHEVTMYIPTDALPSRALLIANNGINVPAGKDGVKIASDITEEMMLAIAKQTRTITISINDIPNQYLTYTDDGIARKEDDSVAHSWKLFLADPEQRPFMSVHVPMMESIVKTMDLAQQELQPWQINQFIVTGASKRAWSAWLATIADERITAIVPFVIDILNTKKVLQHTYDAYGGNWPLAFGSYQREGITSRLLTDNFDKLMQIEDPLHYLNSAYGARLAIPKYIVNASSDDFFVPDNAGFYFDQLPGKKSLRVAPNASHYGIKNFVEQSLITVTNRLQQTRALPTITAHRQPDGDVLSLDFSEAPIAITQWTATNPVTRDFRYPCGIRYQATDIMPSGPQSATAFIKTPKEGWSATFIEAKFSDRFVATTPVYVMPNTYPTSAPPVVEPACKTLP